MSEPGEGHNSALTPDQRSALRMHHVKRLLDIDAEMAPLRQRRKELRAEAKGDGFKLSEIDAAIRLATMEDTSIFVSEIKELIEIAKAFNALPPGEQGDLFPDRRPVDERCFDEGKVAGLAGKNPEPPYGADSENGQAWMRGWHEGQRIMRDDLKAAMEKKMAAQAEDADPDFPDDEEERPEAAE